MQTQTTIAVFGAGGSMGVRASQALKEDPDYQMLYVEKSEEGRARLLEHGLEVSEQGEALQAAEVVILAVPDTLIGKIAAEIVPVLRSGAMVICLDPAAPYAGELPEREDVSYFVTHPAHPPIFNGETEPEARRDFFGSGNAKQAIVNALVQGADVDYTRGEAIASKMWRPVLRSHRVTVEQMAILEPVLSETVAATCLTVIREAMDESISRGVPEEAARDFIMGHFNVELAILFDEIDWDFSAGAKTAIEDAKKTLFKPDWKKVFDERYLRESVENITGNGGKTA